MMSRASRERTPRRRICGAMIGALAVLPLLTLGCMSFLTNSAILADSSHFGTPYSGARSNAHTLICFGRSVARDPWNLAFTPFMLFPLTDLALSATVDTLLLPVEVFVDAEAKPLIPGKASCKLIGM